MATVQPPNVELVPDFVPDPQTVFWDLQRALFRCKDVTTIEGKEHRRLNATFFRQNASVDIERIFENVRQGQTSNNRGAAFPPIVGVLAGLILRRCGRMPDMAVVQLYRDGSDFCGYHADGEMLMGPEAGNALIPILSFGAPRVMSLRPMGVESDAEVEHLEHVLEAGSLFEMRGDMQRRWLHAIREAPEEKTPRISVTFMFRQTSPMAELPWSLYRDGDSFGERPQIPIAVHVGTPRECVEKWEAWPDKGPFYMVSPKAESYTSPAIVRQIILKERGRDFDVDDVDTNSTAGIFNQALAQMAGPGGPDLPDTQDLNFAPMPTEWLTSLNHTIADELEARTIEDLEGEPATATGA